MDFFSELNKAHYQVSVPAAILMALRGRIERKSGDYSNRIGSVFPNGDQSVLLFGPGGTGKTTVMSKIYGGLGMESDQRVEFKTSGTGTSVGLEEMIRTNSKSVLFLDEMDWDNKEHLGLFKQLANGKVCRQKSGESVEFEFDGVVVASTNSITVPKGNKREHLMATLDRFIVVKTERCNIDHDEILDQIIAGESFDEDEINWDLIADRLNSDWDSPITNGESSMIKAAWKSKYEECLDPSREQFRNMHRLKDCLLFVKRMEQCPDVSKDKELMKVFADLVNDLVIVNKASLTYMDRAQRQVYSVVKNSAKALSPKEIMQICEEQGATVELRTLHRKLRSLVDDGFIYKSGYGEYSIKKIEQEERSSCRIKI